MQSITMIPLEQINIPNPRIRNAKIHQEIIENISRVGLKRPITVRRRQEALGAVDYDLVCGQGRLQAFQTLGKSKIPAFVIDVSPEECMLMSLVENIARKPHTALEAMTTVEALRKHGYDEKTIATKLGVTASWVNMLCRLMDQGEERLLKAVYSGLIPVALAIDIARCDEPGVQEALADAYANGLRGRKLITIRKILHQRAIHGKLAYTPGRTPGKRPTLSSKYLQRTYRSEVDKQIFLTRKAELTHSKVMFVVHALNELREDRNFAELVRREGLDTLPLALAKQMSTGGMS